MDDQKIPVSYQAVIPHLIVKDAEKFIAFTAKVFGATESHKTMRDGNTIMHAEIIIKGSTIMFADSTDEYKPRTAGLFIQVDNADETFKKAIEEGATVVTPLSDKPYGRSGGVTDPFGNSWWITSIK